MEKHGVMVADSNKSPDTDREPYPNTSYYSTMSLIKCIYGTLVACFRVITYKYCPAKIGVMVADSDKSTDTDR